MYGKCDPFVQTDWFILETTSFLYVSAKLMYMYNVQGFIQDFVKGGQKQQLPI